MYIPSELVIDTSKDTQAVFATPTLTEALPNIVESFNGFDESYAHNRDATLRFMAESVFQFGGSEDKRKTVDAALLVDDETANSDQLMVVLSPLNDSRPLSTPDVMASYVRITDPTQDERDIAQPNSWDQITKIMTNYEVGKKEGVGMPTLVLFSPISPAVFSEAQWQAIQNGDHSPFGSLVRQAIGEASQKLGHDVETVHFFGAGMGHNVIGAARYLSEVKAFKIGSITVQNLVMGQRSRRELLAHYAGPGEKSGKPAGIGIPTNENGEEYTRISEPLLRHEIDGKGSEKAMRMRQVKAMLNMGYFKGMAKSAWLHQSIHTLAVQRKVPFTVANAHNSSLTQRTKKYLPEESANFSFIDVVGIDDQRPYMMTNEQAALGAVISILGVKKALELAN